MIEINDTDLPITVAAKIITGTMTGTGALNGSVDMFDLKEIKEIANYLLTYYESHKDGD